MSPPCVEKEGAVLHTWRRETQNRPDSKPQQGFGVECVPHRHSVRQSRIQHGEDRQVGAQVRHHAAAEALRAQNQDRF